uniref:Copper transporter n=1 Tax=Steinernema glaseri TaxID=37863 RepID=A0A1I8AH85_9BILA
MRSPQRSASSSPGNPKHFHFSRCPQLLGSFLVSLSGMEHSWLWYAPDVGLVFLVSMSLVSLFVFLRWLFLQGGPPVAKPTPQVDAA